MQRYVGAKVAATTAFVALVLSLLMHGFVPGVSAHGKLMSPLGASTSPQVAASAQSDVAIGVTAVSPCGTTLGRPFDRNDRRPRAEYYPGQQATLEWHTVNQDGAGPVRVRFSPDNGMTWKDADITKNVPGIIGLDASSLPIIGRDQSHPLQIRVPNMNCPPGQCMMMVSTPLTFGSCSPVSIQSGNSGRAVMSYTSAGGTMGGGAKGLMAGGLGGVLDFLHL